MNYHIVKVQYISVKKSLLVIFLPKYGHFCRINKESIVDVEGEVKAAAQKVQSCSQEDVEIFVDKVLTLMKEIHLTSVGVHFLKWVVDQGNSC